MTMSTRPSLLAPLVAIATATATLGVALPASADDDFHGHRRAVVVHDDGDIAGISRRAVVGDDGGYAARRTTWHRDDDGELEGTRVATATGKDGNRITAETRFDDGDIDRDITCRDDDGDVVDCADLR